MKISGQTMDDNVRNLIISNNEQEARINAISLKIDNRIAEILQRLKNLEDAAKAQRNTDY